MNVQTPVACTLNAGDYKKRMERIDRLNRKRLVRHEQGELTLRLFYLRSARTEVRKIVELERTCCAFLDFDTDETGDEVVLTISAHEHAQVAAQSIFADFTAGARSGRASACGCC